MRLDLDHEILKLYVGTHTRIMKYDPNHEIRSVQEKQKLSSLHTTVMVVACSARMIFSHFIFAS